MVVTTQLRQVGIIVSIRLWSLNRACQVSNSHTLELSCAATIILHLPSNTNCAREIFVASPVPADPLLLVETGNRNACSAHYVNDIA